MIKRIIEADREARAMEEANLKESELQKQKIEEEAKKIYDKYMRQALETVEQNNKLEQAKTEKLWHEISSRQNSAFIKLQSDYKNNCDHWVDEIVSRTLGA